MESYLDANMLVLVMDDYYVNHGSATASGWVRLYHGTDIESAAWIVKYGLDEAKASACGGEGKFWLTPELLYARAHAFGSLSNKPTIIALELPLAAITTCLSDTPPSASLHPNPPIRYEFRQRSFPIIQESMANVALIDAKMTFTEK